ncbi:tRNA (adenosine(37)-N6)-dimethylallyltransferase MiaA [Albidovulum sp.]|uniref:tRNA (adenosine(37)-N6)-dimethylallyltransferase MiaA n=1 Tax=Albidovulum sp. TaxID=1872424 RepID=UPI003529BBF9
MDILSEIPDDVPVLIAGPTAAGKSALALAIAEARGGMIVNADALQVWRIWRVLTARPGPQEEARVPHRLYGHLASGQDYSVGHWLREVAPLLDGPARPIIVGGTGLYLSALTEGLAEIPSTPAQVRQAADACLAERGLEAMIAALDPATRARIDTRNPARVQRAWEVLTATGRGLAGWQDETPPPLLPAERAVRLVIDAPRDWLAERIDRRLVAMVAGGALDEARAALPDWAPPAPWTRAIGAADLVAHLRAELPLDVAITRAQAATRQYAKRQRSWFRKRMRDWRWIPPPA